MIIKMLLISYEYIHYNAPMVNKLNEEQLEITRRAALFAKKNGLVKTGQVDVAVGASLGWFTHFLKEDGISDPGTIKFTKLHNYLVDHCSQCFEMADKNI